MKWKLLLISISIPMHIFAMNPIAQYYMTEITKSMHALANQESCDCYLKTIFNYPRGVTAYHPEKEEWVPYENWVAGINRGANQNQIAGLYYGDWLGQWAAHKDQLSIVQTIIVDNFEDFMQMCQSKPEEHTVVDTSSSQGTMISNIPMIVGGVGLAAAIYYFGIPWIKSKLIHFKRN